MTEDNKWVGYRFTKRYTSDRVLMEIWKDLGNNGDTTPSNQWVRIQSVLEESEHWRQPPNDHIDPPIGQCGLVKNDEKPIVNPDKDIFSINEQMKDV
jgi:hypothetical protein